MAIEQVKLTALESATKSTESDNPKKIEAINTALNDMIGDKFTYEVNKVGSTTEKEKKTFSKESSDEEITDIIVPTLCGDNADTTIKTNLTTALKTTRDALKSLSDSNTNTETDATKGTDDATAELTGNIISLSENPDDYSTNLTNEKLKVITDRKVLKNIPNYIRSIQQLILNTGAASGFTEEQKNKLNDDKIGPITAAGIMTLQQYIMGTYSITKEDLGIKTNSPDGFPGPKTLAALVEKDGDKTRFQKIIDDKPTFSKIYTPEEVSTPAPKVEKTTEAGTKAKENVSKGGKEETKENQALTEKKAKILENLKKIPGLENITTIDGLGISFDKDNKASWTGGLKRTYPTKTDNFEISLVTGYKVDSGKVIKSTEKDISNNYIEIIQENIKDDLGKYLEEHLRFSDKKYQDYYDTQTKGKDIVCNKEDGSIKILWSTVNDSYRISVDPKNIWNAKNTLTDFNSITNIIQQDIISKVDAQEKLQRENKLSKKHDTLKDYLIGSGKYKVFSKEYLYPDFKNLDEGKRNKINAFFKDFKNLIGDNGLSFEYDLDKNSKNKKQILLTVDEDGRNTKYGDITLNVEDKINPDGTVNKEKVRQSLREMTDKYLLAKV